MCSATRSTGTDTSTSRVWCDSELLSCGPARGSRNGNLDRRDDSGHRALGRTDDERGRVSGIVRTPRAHSGHRHGGASVSPLYFSVSPTRFRRAQGWRHLRPLIMLRPRLAGDADENLFTAYMNATRMPLTAPSSSRQVQALPCGGTSLGCACRLPLRGRGRRRRVEAQVVRVCDDDVCVVVDGLDCMHWKLPARLPSEVCASHCRFRCDV